MSDQEVDNLLEKLKQEFGDKLPNPDYFPESFLYYVKLYRYLLGKTITSSP